MRLNLKRLRGVPDNVEALLRTDLVSTTIYARPAPILIALVALALGGAVFILSHAIHVAHLTHPGGKAVGYVDRLNWGYMYITVFPLCCALASWANRSLANSMISLHSRRIISRLDTESNLDPPDSGERRRFADDFARLLFIHRRTLMTVCVVLVVVLMYFDTMDERTIFYEADRNMILEADKEWFNAYADWNVKTKKPTFELNMLFDLLAYSLQAVFLFLGVHLIGKFILYLYTVMHLERLTKKRIEKRVYRYYILADNELRGLNPLSRLYNLCLSLVTVFGGYLALHRWQEMIESDRNAFMQSWSAVTKRPFDVIAFVRPFESGLWRAGWNLEFAMWLGFYAFLFGLMCYYPAYKWRRFVRGKVNELNIEYDRLKVQLERDKQADEELVAQRRSRADRLKSAIDSLRAVSVWPNGNKSASVFLTCILVFAFFALYPGTPPYAYLVILALVIWKAYFGKWSRI